MLVGVYSENWGLCVFAVRTGACVLAVKTDACVCLQRKLVAQLLTYQFMW